MRLAEFSFWNMLAETTNVPRDFNADEITQIIGKTKRPPVTAGDRRAARAYQYVNHRHGDGGAITVYDDRRHCVGFGGVLQPFDTHRLYFESGVAGGRTGNGRDERFVGKSEKSRHEADISATKSGFAGFL